jgi:hypothetical protein
MKIKREPTRLQKKAKQGHHGYPVATIAFYGPDASRASKVVVGVVLVPDGEADEMRKWFSDTADLRRDPTVHQEIMAYLAEHAVKSVAMGDGMMGCPHEEGPDYPLGHVCPMCPYWADRDRFTGEKLSVQ